MSKRKRTSEIEQWIKQSRGTGIHPGKFRGAMN